MIKIKREKINFNLKFNNIQEYSDSLLIATVNVMYAGHNRNRSHISKECADKMFSKAAYAPVFIEFKKDEAGEDIAGSHGGRVEIDDEGIRFVDTTIIAGCVLNEPYWIENIDNEDYYCVKVALYKEKYPQIQTIVENGVNQSMEISCIKADYKDDDILYIEEARLDGLCMISVEPCFESSAVRCEFSSQEEAKAKFEFAYTEIINKVKEVFETEETPEDEEEDESFKNEDEDKKKCETGEDKTEEEPKEEQDPETEEDEDFADEDEDKKKCEEDEEDDKIEDNSPENTEEDKEDEEGFSIEEYKALIVEYSNLEAKFEALNKEILELRQFKSNIEKEERKIKVDEVASKFNLDETEIGDLREKAYNEEISIECFEDKLFSIMGRKVLKNKNFSKQTEKRTNISKIKIGEEDSGEFGYLTSLIKK